MSKKRHLKIVHLIFPFRGYYLFEENLTISYQNLFMGAKADSHLKKCIKLRNYRFIISSTSTKIKQNLSVS